MHQLRLMYQTALRGEVATLNVTNGNILKQSTIKTPNVTIPSNVTIVSLSVSFAMLLQRVMQQRKICSPNP